MTPPVTELEAGDDRHWFAHNPKRRYRLREAADGWWIIRRRTGGVLLRTWTPVLAKGFPDTDQARREAWFAAAWPALNPLERAEL